MDWPARSFDTRALAPELSRDCASAATVAWPIGPHAKAKQVEEGKEAMRTVTDDVGEEEKKGGGEVGASGKRSPHSILEKTPCSVTPKPRA